MFQNASASGFTCSSVVSDIASQSAIALNNALFVVWIGFGFIVFFLAFQTLAGFFRK